MLQHHHQTPAPHLKWLFIAFFEDGFTIQQTAEDKAETSDTGSAFTDVVKRQESKKLIAFELQHEDGKQKTTVDLITGTFIINGTPFVAHNQHFNPENYDLKLIYFRETRVEKDIKGTLLEDGNVKQEQVGELRHFINRYFVGYECIVNGKNKQVTVAVG